MGVLGGLYRPTPQGYNSNPAGRGSQPSVSVFAGFSTGHWARRLVGPAGFLVDRPAPPLGGLAGGGLLLPHP